MLRVRYEDRNDPSESMNCREQWADLLNRYHAEMEAKQLKVEIDIDSNVIGLDHATSLTGLQACLLENAIARSPHGGSIEICVFDAVGGVELEIAFDGDPGASPHSTSAFRTSEPGLMRDLHFDGRTLQLIRAAGLRIRQLRCPQGGIAWQVIIPRRSAMQRAA